jgi:hypothetical protein
MGKEHTMTTFTTTAPATVSVKVQGFATDIDVSALPLESLHAMIAYGVRRKYQDSINSTAAALRDAGESVDGEALFNEFHTRVLDGALGVRGESVTADPLDKYRREIVREALARDKDGKGWKAYAAIDAKDRKARDVFLLTIATNNAAKVDPVARERLEADRNKVKGLDFDL